MLTFVVPAHNEEDSLQATIRSIQQAARAAESEFEIIVVDDASTDRTAAIARSLDVTVLGVDLRHIAAARNAGASASSGELLIFVDADTVIPETIVVNAMSAIAGGAIGGGARVRLEPVAPLWARVIFRIGSWIYFRYNLAAGCFVFVRRDAFDKIGGFDETYFATEEVHLSRSLHRLGRFVILDDAVVTSHRKFDLVSPGRFFGELLRAIRKPGSVIRKRHWWWYGIQREQTPNSRQRKH